MKGGVIMRNKMKATLGLLVTTMIILIGAGRVWAGKVVTLADNLRLKALQTIELDPVNVGTFRFVSLLGNKSGGNILIRIAFSAESGKFSDPVPRMYGGKCFMRREGFVEQCKVFEISGPFLAIRLFSKDPSAVTLKVFLSK